MGVEVTVDCLGNLQCRALHDPSQVNLQTEAPKDNGGQGRYFSPTDLVAAALGTCAGTTMEIIGKRHGIDVTGTKIKVIKEMIADPKRRIARLTTQINFPSALATLSPEQKLILEDAARFCPVKMSLNADTDLTFSFEYG